MAESIHLLPPPLFLAGPGDPPVRWSQWIKSFRTYISSAGLPVHSDEIKRAVLINCLGLAGQRIFTTLEAGPSFEEAVDKLATFFEPRFRPADADEQLQSSSGTRARCMSCFSGIYEKLKCRFFTRRKQAETAETEDLSTPIQETEPVQFQSSVRPWFDL